MEIKNLKKATKRILSAIKKNERIILYSDADLDGTVSLLILEEAIKSLGGKIGLCYFLDRAKEGCGLAESALEIMKERAPALLILTDCGIGSLKEIQMAHKMGFETIIIDHHETLNHVPENSIVINPKQKGDKYPFKFMSACGLCFKVIEALFGGKISRALEQSFIELVALATLADMMPQEEDNKIFIEKGLNYLPFTFRPGLRAFFSFFSPQDFSQRELAQRIISILIRTETKNHLTESYLLLTTSDLEKAKEYVKGLSEKSARLQQVLRALTLEIEEKLANSSSTIVFEGGSDFPQILIGSLASRICNKFKKPTFIFTTGETLSRGSVRIPKGVNSVKALGYCRSLLEVYGGHSQASGFTVKNENLEKLKECLTKYFKQL